MKIIRTVAGDIAPESLGYTQCHEHIFVERDKSAEVSDVLLIDDLEKSTEELFLYRGAGGRALVDAQPVMAGRMAEWEFEASSRAGVEIIACTGFHKTVFYYDDSYIFKMNGEQIAGLYIDEVLSGMLSSKTEGYQKTGYRAGVIKTAVDSGGVYADKIYEKLHTAAAEAHGETGAPVMCHMEKGADAAELIDFYIKHGVPQNRLWLAHLDRAEDDLAVHRDILSGGTYLEYDTIARPKYHDDEKESEIITEMLEAGYERQLLLGLDTTRARLKSYGAPGPGWTIYW